MIKQAQIFGFVFFLLSFCLCLSVAKVSGQSSVKAEVVKLKATKLVIPAYPETAKKAGVGGEVMIGITIDEKGNVIKAEVGTGELLLCDASLAAARASKFSPNIVKGKAVKTSGFIFFNFIAPSPNTDDSKIFEEYLKNSEVDFWGTVKTLQDSKQAASIVAKKSDGNACLIMSFKELDKTTYKSKLVDAQILNANIKICDDSIKIDSAKPFKFYNRGLARYYLIRGDETPLGKTLTEASYVSADDLRQSLADLKVFIDSESSRNFVDELKMAYRAAGELAAVFAIKEQNRENLQVALKLLDTAEKTKASIGSADEYMNKIIVADRQTINAVFANNTTGMSSTLSAEVRSRYQKYAGEYSALETVYKTKVQSFQEILKAHQGTSSPDKVCQSLSEMNTSFQVMKTGFAKISEMNNKGELNGDVNLAKQVQMREAQQVKAEAQIYAAAAKFGCQLK